MDRVAVFPQTCTTSVWPGQRRSGRPARPRRLSPSLKVRVDGALSRSQLERRLKGFPLSRCWVFGSRVQPGADQAGHLQNLSTPVHLPAGRCLTGPGPAAAEHGRAFTICLAFVCRQGGPYHDVLHSILGAYTCYRPDVGYVSPTPQISTAKLP